MEISFWHRVREEILLRHPGHYLHEKTDLCDRLAESSLKTATNCKPSDVVSSPHKVSNLSRMSMLRTIPESIQLSTIPSKSFDVLRWSILRLRSCRSATERRRSIRSLRMDSEGSAVHKRSAFKQCERKQPCGDGILGFTDLLRRTCFSDATGRSFSSSSAS